MALASSPEQIHCPGNKQAHVLQFRPLFGGRHEFVFPCDATGVVNLDALSEIARANYFFARACVGRVFAYPTLGLA
jgi:hypothetical protein